MAETEIKSINGKTLADVSAREKKIEKNQGVENAGKILGIDVDGNVTPQNKPVQALAGASAPTTTTAGVVGQEYYVIVGNAVTEMYVCTAVANGTYTWDKVEFGGACMDITGAKVGQIAKIKAVDSAGKPTAWEPVDMPGGGEKWEKIAEIELRSDTAKYVLADFATWRKAKVIMIRPKYISGLNKYVWCKCETPTKPNFYACGFMTMSYGYIYWDYEAEVNDLFITSSFVATNNRESPQGIQSTGILMPLSIAPSEIEFTLSFFDTSVIQEGDKVSVIGVRR